MKRVGIIVFTALSFAFIIVIANVVQQNNVNNSYSMRNIYMNRITTMLEREASNNYNMSESEISDKLERLVLEQKDGYNKLMIPSDTYYLSIESFSSQTDNISDVSLRPLNINGENNGFIVFKFDDVLSEKIVIIMNVFMIGCSVICLIVLLYVYVRIIRPFNTLSDYPMKLSRGIYIEKLPETKNKYFGNFIWGVNILCDKIYADKKRINRLMKEKQTLITTIAHGIKTPVSNIQLYAEAIQAGLYQSNGVPDEADSEIARKIGRNADEISTLVREMISTASDGLVEFEPNIGEFYIGQLLDTINEEYSNRLKLLRIPFEIKLLDNGILKSDRVGLLRILSQLMENAIKYGDGRGIAIKAEKQDDGCYFSVKSKGGLISDSELPYIFNSFWRGSNSKDIEGSGIGLYEAKKIANRLSGDVCAKCIKETDEMEFVVFIP